VRFLSSRRGIAAVAVLLLVLFLFRPGVYQLRNRIAGSIGSALGRRVTLDNVRLRILPRPGFDLEGLIIYDDPVFSAEPMIRAQDVSAAIRFRSLLRGRLEIATLSATEPSINLVRNGDGRWNLASLLERNAQIPAAPTGKPASERRPAFPYLEASNARVNLKIGQTKKSYALMNADVALWQDSENSWGARMKAAPVRTDFNLTDTGLLQINATWQRAQSLQLTPVQMAVQWQNGQLGQITKLLSGKDRGWRGGVTFTAQLSGTPVALRIETQTAIEDFHRYDIVGNENVRLVTACSGQYNAATRTLAELLCESPVNGGMLRLRGTLTTVSQPAYDLRFEADKVPLTSMVRLLHQVKKQIPADLTASGVLNADFGVTSNSLETAQRGLSQHLLQRWTGSGSATGVEFSANKEKNKLSLGTIPLSLVFSDSPKAESGRMGVTEKEQEAAEPHLRIGPVALAVNASAPASVGGWVSSEGYRFFLRGDMELKELFRLEDVFGLPVARPAAEGSAKLDVSVSGLWQGFAIPAALGTAQLRNVRAETRGLNTPIEIISATVMLAPDSVSMQRIAARTGNTHWSGGVMAPRHCTAPGVAPACSFQFDLTADQLSTGDLAEWFTPHAAKRPWYRILNPAETPGDSPLLAIQAHGNLHVGRFVLKKVTTTQVSTTVEADRGKITLTALRAQLLQGTHQGNWIIDATGHNVPGDGSTRDAPVQVHYHGHGKLQDISLDQVSILMNDAWVTGTADGSFDLDGSGDDFRELLTNSDGKLQFAMRNGSLPHVEIPGSPVPLPAHRFAGALRLKKGVWELSEGRLESRDGLYQINGTASQGRGFDFVLTRGDEQSWTLRGTLAKPRVEPVGRTEAQRTEAGQKNVKR
jgi:hypothetical protein